MTTFKRGLQGGRRNGFTLVELLVVVAIIGMLIALLLPAVQGAREAGRSTQCTNNVRQLALACLAHEEAQQYLPAGGWGFRCLGLASRGFGPGQPGGWIYSILPNLDQASLWDGGGATNVEQAMTTLVQTPLPVLYCPSRRACRTYPEIYSQWMPYGIPPPTQVARNDYAMNIADGDGGGAPPVTAGPSNFISGPVLQIPPLPTDGVTGEGWWVSMASITDGAGNTYLLGEKSLPADHYTDGVNFGDNEDAYVGADRDTLRGTFTDESSVVYPVARDQAGVDNSFAFGSAHYSGFHMAFCDGRVQQITYAISPAVHEQLGNRHDGAAPNMSGL
ncbi:MAG: DUF1559 domain-containing protein [Thermoguttaceae bacterium]